MVTQEMGLGGSLALPGAAIIRLRWSYGGQADRGSSPGHDGDAVAATGGRGRPTAVTDRGYRR